MNNTVQGNIYKRNLSPYVILLPQDIIKSSIVSNKYLYNLFLQIMKKQILQNL